MLCHTCVILHHGCVITPWRCYVRNGGVIVHYGCVIVMRIPASVFKLIKFKVSLV